MFVYFILLFVYFIVYKVNSSQVTKLCRPTNIKDVKIKLSYKAVCKYHVTLWTKYILVFIVSHLFSHICDMDVSNSIYQ